MGSRWPAYRLACLVSHPIQYQAPLLRAVARERSIDLTALFLSDFSVRTYRDRGFGSRVRWDVPLLGGYRHLVLAPSRGSTTPSDPTGRWRPWVPRLGRVLAEGRYDALWIHGWSHQTSWRAIAAARRLGMKVLLRGESNLLGRPRHGLRRLLLARLFRRVDGFLAIGSANREFYRSHGVPDERIVSMPYAIDNDALRDRVQQAAAKRAALRRLIGFDESRPVILFCAKLLPRKRPFDLLDAYRQLSPDGVREPDAGLVFVGDGPLREELQARARALGWSSIRFAGFRNQTELPAFYDLCDVLVLPSEHETWGLVVNEALAAGRAVVVSDRVGCGPDLVRDGENGFVFPLGDVAALADRLRRTLAEGAPARMGLAGRARIEGWGLQQDVDGLLAALRATVGP